VDVQFGLTAYGENILKMFENRVIREIPQETEDKRRINNITE
jgi:hypothetical protein